MKKAWIFDLDGTLLDSMPVWEEVGDAFLKERGVHNPPKDLSETLKPLGVKDTAEYMRRTFGFTESADEIIDKLNAQMEQRYRMDIPLKPGVLEFLNQNKGTPMCVATATCRHLVEPVLERLGIAHFFSFILTSSEVGCTKQKPDIYLQAAKKMGADIADCVVFEDAIHAAETAKNAGFYVVGILDGNMTQDSAALQAVCDEMVQDLRECSV